MPICPSRPVNVQPTVWLERWRVLETDLGTRHFTGYSVEDRIGRASSPIESYDIDTRSGITRSGRQYHLLGSPGHDMEAEYVWQCWSALCGVKETLDVTTEYLDSPNQT